MCGVGGIRGLGGGTIMRLVSMPIWAIGDSVVLVLVIVSFILLLEQMNEK